MSDPRFASLKTDPRFRRPKKHHSKVVLDDRFKDLLRDEKKKKKKERNKPTSARVDKYGRTVSETQEKDDLRRFYKLETDDGEEDPSAAPPPVVDYARGAVLMESSDEEEEDRDLPPRSPAENGSDSDGDQDGFISLGTAPRKRSEEDADEDDLGVDLDENTIATLDAQVAEYAKTVPERDADADVQRTRRLAVVNLDWDYVRAVHLYKIFSSLVSSTAPPTSAETNPTLANNGGVNVAKGRILSVRVYPSEFGKKRMAKEEKEGPPAELFRKKSKKVEDDEINEKTIIETGDEADYDEDALRKYQLERLRYYYAIAECDTVEAAAHVYNELEGTELERSANVFDLSFVPDDITFDDEPRDEVTQLSNAPYRAVEFTTDALRHSKVKLTWDEDDPERNHFLRRPLTKKEIEEADFRAYVASSSSSEGGSEDEGGDATDSKTRRRKTKKEGKSAKKAERDRLRMLLLGGNDELPEGWDDAFDNKASRVKQGKTGAGEDSDVDMEVTFMPGLSEVKNPEDENTLDRYQRKTREKRKKKKEDVRERGVDDDDEFFVAENGGQHEEEGSGQSKKKSTKPKKPTETSNSPSGEPAHFDMKAVLKAEKQGKRSKSKHKSKKRRGEDDADDGPGETQEDFTIDVKDDRFSAIHEDHRFAIDPTHPQFKKTKSMAALLNERSKRQKTNGHSDHPVQLQGPTQQSDGRSLQSLVESVKRKSTTLDHGGLGKRRKLGKS